jgi:hypothetical protein
MRGRDTHVGTVLRSSSRWSVRVVAIVEVVPMRAALSRGAWPWLLVFVVIAAVAAVLSVRSQGERAGPGAESVEPNASATETDETPELAAQPETIEVRVFFSRGELEESCAAVDPVVREVAGTDPLTGALEALLAGPTPAEVADGFGGWFTTATAGMLRSVEVRGEVAYVDLDDLREVIPDASTSCGSALLLAQLDGTVTSTVEVDRVVYSIDGDTETFYAWLQYDVPSEEVSAPLTVDRIVALIESELETEALTDRDVTLSCDADGAVAAGDVFVCSIGSDPPEPADWGSGVVAVLSNDLFALSLATDNPASTEQLMEQYAASPTGLSCADLRAGEATFPFDVSTTDDVGSIFWSIVYWNLEGQPDRMDVDLDGVPCETLYPDGAVDSVLRTARSAIPLSREPG